MDIYFLKEEEQDIMNNIKLDKYSFVTARDLPNLKCDILFVFDRNLLKDFILDLEKYHKLFETSDINYIVVESLDMFEFIRKHFDEIITTKIEECYLNKQKDKNLYRFLRYKDKKLYTIIKNFSNFYYVKDVDGRFTAIDDNKCSKCFDYIEASDEIYKDHYEKDINIMTRYALEMVKKNRVKIGKDYRIVTYDIETLASVDAVNTPQPIIAIAAHDSLTKELKYWEIRELDEKKEKEMLEDFFIYVSKFDVICGFNINKFDIPYLINRANKLGVDTTLLTAIPSCRPSSKFRGKEEISPFFSVIPGINIIDLIGLAEKSIGYLDVKLPDKKLDTLGKYILGESKVEVETPAILFNKKDFEKLKEYTLQDVNIAVKLDEKLGLIELLLATIELVPGLNLDSAVWNSKIIDFYLLSKFPNIIMPSVIRDRQKDIKGAIVFDTIAGIHDNVGVFDCAGMYPSLIRTFNISPDTKDPNGEINLNNTKFVTTKKGILVKLVDDFTELRKLYKIKKKEHEKDKDYKLWQLKEFTVKKILASTYGVFGYSGFRFFDNDIANAITFAGRELLTHMKDFSEKAGYKVIMGDTDGIALNKKDDSIPDFDKLCKDMNESLPQWISKYTSNEEYIKNHKILIEYETLFERVIFTTAKKKYMGLVRMSKGKKLEELQFYGKGNELMRKDTPQGMKKELSKIIMEVLNNKEKSKNIVLIQDRINDIKKSIVNWKTDDLIIYKEINRDFEDYKVKPIHVRGALNSNKHLGTTFSRQDYKGGYVFVKCSKDPCADVLFMNDNTKLSCDFVIDYDKYFEKFIVQKIKLIFGDYIFSKVFQKNKLLAEFF